MAVKHTIRKRNNGIGGVEKTRTANFNPLQAIKSFCFECVCWESKEVEICSDKKCALYPFRLGTDPSKKPRKTK